MPKFIVEIAETKATELMYINAFEIEAIKPVLHIKNAYVILMCSGREYRVSEQQVLSLLDMIELRKGTPR